MTLLSGLGIIMWPIAKYVGGQLYDFGGYPNGFLLPGRTPASSSLSWSSLNGYTGPNVPICDQKTSFERSVAGNSL